MSIIRAADVTPNTAPYQLYFLLNSLIGASVISLTITYLMQVYNALQRRNTLAYKLYLQSGETSDAAELLAGLGSRGSFQCGYAALMDIAVGAVNDPVLPGVRCAVRRFPWCAQGR